MTDNSPKVGDVHEVPSPGHLVGVWAHPDDEAYLSAGLMARTVEQGGRVTLLTLTDGEAGFPEDDRRPASQRRHQRREELRAAMATIGVDDVRFLGIPDGTLADGTGDLVVAAIIAVLHEVNPDLVLTFGPDGITGHADHVATWRLATRAMAAYPCGVLWYATKSTAWLDEWRRLHDEFDVWMTAEPTGVPENELELAIGLEGPELDRKRAVLAAHASQTEALSGAFGEETYRRWIRSETFRRPTDLELAAFAGEPSGLTAWEHAPAATAAVAS